MKKKTYRIRFLNQNKVYEIYARSVRQSEIFGFVVVEQIVFGERGGLLVDPQEETVRLEFQNVEATHIPLQSVIRIDEVEKTGPAKVLGTGSASEKASENVMVFPLPPPTGQPGEPPQA